MPDQEPTPQNLPQSYASFLRDFWIKSAQRGPFALSSRGGMMSQFPFAFLHTKECTCQDTAQSGTLKDSGKLSAKTPREVEFIDPRMSALELLQVPKKVGLPKCVYKGQAYQFESRPSADLRVHTVSRKPVL